MVLTADFDNKKVSIGSEGLEINGTIYGWTYIDVLKEKFKEENEQCFWKGPYVRCWCGLELGYDEECFECYVDLEN